MKPQVHASKRKQVRYRLGWLFVVILPLLLIGCDTVDNDETPMTVQEENKATMQRFIEAVNTHNLEALDALVQDDFARHSQATPGLNIRSLAEFKQFLVQDQATFPDAHQVASMMIAEGDKVAVYMTLTGTQEGPFGPFPATGKQVTVQFLGIIQFEAGKIAEMWVEWDNLNMLTQLGLFPPPGGPTKR